jgi:hypothetical protein
VQGCGHASEQHSVSEVSSAPPHVLDEELGSRPADRRSKPAGKGESSDGLPCVCAEDATKGGKGRIIERHRNCHSQQNPDREVHGRVARVSERNKAQRGDNRADGHDTVAAVSIDECSHAR